MKKFLVVLVLLSVLSCGEDKKIGDNQKVTAELQEWKALESEEEGTKKFIEDYLRDMNSSDWKSKLRKYLQPDPEEFITEHAVFRESFPNYRSTIKHLTVDGNKGIVWFTISANYVKTYSFESKTNDYGDNVLNGIKAENQPLSWDEVWYFDVVDGKFGAEWDFLKDNYAVLKGLKVN